MIGLIKHVADAGGFSAGKEGPVDEELKHVPVLPQSHADQKRHHLNRVVVRIGIIVFGNGKRLGADPVSAELLQRTPAAVYDAGNL